MLKSEMPTGINPSGHLVLATSYSRTAYRRTTIGAAAFHCRVRNGNGWDHCASVTRGPSRTGTWNRTGGFAAVAAAATQAPTRISGDVIATCSELVTRHRSLVTAVKELLVL